MSLVAQAINGPIRVGDMVRLTLPSPCCGSPRSIGFEYRIVEIKVLWTECVTCGAPAARLLAFADDGIGEMPCTLLRLDPPAIPDAVEQEREVTA